MSHSTTAPLRTAHASPDDSTTSRPLPRRLLGVWAHPDDEVYLSAGLMARVADDDGLVTVVTATCGELGTDDDALVGSERFAGQRRRELEASLAELGVHDVRLLDLPDGGCASIPAAQPIASIAEVIDEVRPELIVTFGPDGITWHPDHRAVSAWATAAWLLTGSDATLLYATRSADFERRFSALHAELGIHDVFGPGHAATSTTSEIALDVALTRTELARKRRALARHASQTAALAAAIGEHRYLAWVSEESFRHPTAAEQSAALRLDDVVFRTLAGAR
jgi:LmbE family N-acetylglucosaminyl deacetylase